MLAQVYGAKVLSEGFEMGLVCGQRSAPSSTTIILGSSF